VLKGITRLLWLLPLIAQTNTSSINEVMNSTMGVVMAVIPLMVIILVIKLLFNSFAELSNEGRTAFVRKLNLTKLFPLLLLLAQTTTTTSPANLTTLGWNTEYYKFLVTIVMMSIPFLVTIVIVRSVFKSFTKEWA